MRGAYDLNGVNVEAGELGVETPAGDPLGVDALLESLELVDVLLLSVPHRLCRVPGVPTFVELLADVLVGAILLLLAGIYICKSM